MAIDSEKIAAVKTAMDNTYEKRVNKKTTISGSYTGDTDSYPTILACINKFGELITSWNVTPSDAHYPSEKLVKDTLENYIQKSQTAGLVKNDGTIDTNTYLTQHQDISGKANSADLATVATSGSYTDLTNVPQTFTPASHTHGNITATGAIGSDSGKMITTTTNGILVASDMNEQLNSIILGLIAEGTPVATDWMELTYYNTNSIIVGYGKGTFLFDGECTIDWGDGAISKFTSYINEGGYPDVTGTTTFADGTTEEFDEFTHTYSDGLNQNRTVKLSTITGINDNLHYSYSINEVVIPKSVISISDEALGVTEDNVVPTIEFKWDTAETIIPYNQDGTTGTTGKYGWLIRDDYTLYIPYGTTALYVAKGYPSEQLVERSQS